VSALRLALYQPDIPQNAGTLMRMAACLGVAVDLIEPAGFDASDRNLRRAGLDYLGQLELTRHISFAAFQAWRRERGCRVVLATTKAERSHLAFAFEPGDIVMVGRESAGVPDDVRAAIDAEGRDPDAGRSALAQCRRRGRDRAGRGAPPDRRVPGDVIRPSASGAPSDASADAGTKGAPARATPDRLST
jgi:tRNA (cytidine/uridine-2'-O-)-methyltransferase